MVDIPEHLLQRSKEARERLTGEGESGGDAPAAGAPAETAEAEPEPEAPAAEAPAPAAEAPAPAAAAAAPAAETSGGAVAAPPKPAPAPAAAPAAAAARPTPVAAATAAPARTQRLLAVVKSGSIQTTKKDPIDKVNTWPHLLVAEFVAALAISVAVIAFSILLNAPLQGEANPNLTPNPSKAPWYFLGLQELLTVFHPMVAGVTIPGIGIFALLAVPYIDRNPATKPSERKFAIAIFTFFMMYWAILVMLGSFFRGPGFNFVWPWASGIFFDF